MPQRILVVDDEREIRRLVASYLIDADFVVEELDNGPAVLERLQRQPAIDLIVLDVRMPGPDGIDTLRDLRRFSDVHVIMLTAAAEETDRLIGLSVGADDYITKPFSPREVVARVKAVLRRTRTSTSEQLTEPLRVSASVPLFLLMYMYIYTKHTKRSLPIGVHLKISKENRPHCSQHITTNIPFYINKFYQQQPKLSC